MAWKCKKCGSKKFLKTTTTVTQELVNFDEDGIEDKAEEISFNIQTLLKCAECKNLATIFGSIEDISNWEE